MLDYWRLNEVTKFDLCFLPKLKAFDAFSAAINFSSVDFAIDYCMLQVKPGEVENTEFITYVGLNKVSKMPF